MERVRWRLVFAFALFAGLAMFCFAMFFELKEMMVGAPIYEVLLMRIVCAVLGFCDVSICLPFLAEAGERR